ncbi:MAG: putative transposase [Halioglobus sp.]
MQSNRIRLPGDRTGNARFNLVSQAQNILGAHAAGNMFNLGRHLVGAHHYQDLSVSAFTEWEGAVA